VGSNTASREVREPGNISDDLAIELARIDRELASCRRELEEARREADRQLGAANHRASRISHDLNNVLGMIHMRATLLQGRNELSERVRHDLEAICTACERGGVLSQELQSVGGELTIGAAKPAGWRILIVEREPCLRGGLAAVLRGPYEVVTVDNEQVALDVVAHTTCAFDLVLADLAMPHVSGRELCRRIRARWPTVRILLLANSEDEHGLPRLEPASESVLLKPFTADDLVRKIEELRELRPNAGS
jgi:CheY-like chemotaxis protein